MERLIGFRKFTVMILFLGTMIGFRIADLISGTDFAQNLQVAVVAFFGANLTEHLVSAAKKYIEGKLK